MKKRNFNLSSVSCSNKTLLKTISARLDAAEQTQKEQQQTTNNKTTTAKRSRQANSGVGKPLPNSLLRSTSNKDHPFFLSLLFSLSLSREGDNSSSCNSSFHVILPVPSNFTCNLHKSPRVPSSVARKQIVTQAFANIPNSCPPHRLLHILP